MLWFACALCTQHLFYLSKSLWFHFSSASFTLYTSASLPLSIFPHSVSLSSFISHHSNLNHSNSISVISVLETDDLTLWTTVDDVDTIRCDVLIMLFDMDSVDWRDWATSNDWNFDAFADCSMLCAELLCSCKLLSTVPWANCLKLD